MSAKLNPFRVVLVDDHPVVRVGLNMLLDDSPRWQVVGGAGTAAEAVARCAELRSDLVVMDIRMPGASRWMAKRPANAAAAWRKANNS